LIEHTSTALPSKGVLFLFPERTDLHRIEGANAPLFGGLHKKVVENFAEKKIVFIFVPSKREFF